MEPYTLTRNFLKQDIIDGFSSIIWTERYYGDSEVEIVVPPSAEMIEKLAIGTFLGLDGSEEVMILETMNIEEGKLKLNGISLLPWLDNRFIRTTDKHEDKHWPIGGGVDQTAGWLLWAIVYYMCVEGSPYLNGTYPTGVTNPQSLAIPGLGLRSYDTSGEPVTLAVPYGPVYKALREIATTYEIGMQITLDSVTDTSYSLGFRSYKGINRTTDQTDYPAVRFSPQMESFTDIKELQSIAALKTLVYAFASNLRPAEGEPVITTIPGVSSITGSEYTGFDLRALLVFADDITTDMVLNNPNTLVDILNSRAYDSLTTNRRIQAVDGEIVPESQFQYGIHYNLGDIIEVQGNSGAIQPARITEYIRSQDSAGERAYPTVAMIGA